MGGPDGRDAGAVRSQTAGFADSPGSTVSAIVITPDRGGSVCHTTVNRNNNPAHGAGGSFAAGLVGAFRGAVEVALVDEAQARKGEQFVDLADVFLTRRR